MLREKAKEKLNKKRGSYPNKDSGVTIRLSRKSVKKLTCGVAMDKSVANGFTRAQHYEAVSRANQLYKNAKRLSSKPDKHGDPNVLAVERYSARFRLYGGKRAEAYMTVKRFVRDGDMLYSLELRK